MRVAKVQQKISGCFRAANKAIFLDYVTTCSTAKKLGRGGITELKYSVQKN